MKSRRLLLKNKKNKNACLLFTRGRMKVVCLYSIIVTSDDLKHDSFAVKIFENKAFSTLLSEMPQLQTVHEWTDGCAAQYKGRNAIHILCQLHPPLLRGFQWERCVCDGLGTVVKTVLSELLFRNLSYQTHLTIINITKL